ncbi:MAG: hypothetical protein HY673_22955 [Chloroflexi bacterium]|nr:hypothetical protein [Chloroflexota bacterium]
MGDTAFHLEKARRNERFYVACGAAARPFPEWAVVILFYSALHYVDAALANDSSLSPLLRNPENHSARNEAVRAISMLTPVRHIYRNLYARSLEARYTGIRLTLTDVRNLETICFGPLRDYILQKLNVGR